MTEGKNDILMDVRNLKKDFPITRLGRRVGSIKAVDGVNMMLPRGKTMGLVGESGCGKTTLCRLVMRLLDPSSGQVIFDGENILEYRKEKMRIFRKNMQIIFQDPFSSLDPRTKVGKAIEEPLIYTKQYGGREERKKRVLELLDQVGLGESSYNRYPHEFSGGQRQRICISRALATSPKMVICDEPVSALDVSMRSQVLNLMKDLQERYRLTYLFITHDLSVAKYISDYMSVMYLGRIVELADRDDFYSHPLHPYTQTLMKAIMIPDPDRRREISIFKGELPTPVNPPTGCHFHPRCKYCMDICREQIPEFTQVGEEHYVMCHLYGSEIKEEER